MTSACFASLKRSTVPTRYPAMRNTPRAWGRQQALPNTPLLLGNTPTCVGKTRWHPLRIADERETPPRAWGRRDREIAAFTPIEKHPHVCGEDPPGFTWQSYAEETPPRAWGRQAAMGGTPFSHRNTPTCVGKTRRKGGFERLLGKHPHVRGEDEARREDGEVRTETPPRAWGRQPPHHSGRLEVRNTPTCVGKTLFPFRKLYPFKKHPHVRGEDKSFGTESYAATETPPRAWGRLLMAAKTGQLDGNTPTCVGKTFLSLTRQLLFLETPPRAWGRPATSGALGAKSRNTPTCVGKTLRDYSLFLLSRQNNIEASSFSDTSCSPDNSMSWRFGSPMP